MSLLSGALKMGRAQAVARFTETFTFYSVVESVDPVTLAPSSVETNLYTAVAGRLKFSTLAVSESTAAGSSVSAQSVEIHVAVGATPNVRADHFCRMTASTSDASLVGRVFRIKGSAQAGQVTAARYPVEAQS